MFCNVWWSPLLQKIFNYINMPTVYCMRKSTKVPEKCYRCIKLTWSGLQFVSLWYDKIREDLNPPPQSWRAQSAIGVNSHELRHPRIPNTYIEKWNRGSGRAGSTWRNLKTNFRNNFFLFEEVFKQWQMTIMPDSKRCHLILHLKISFIMYRTS